MVRLDMSTISPGALRNVAFRQGSLWAEDDLRLYFVTLKAEKTKTTSLFPASLVQSMKTFAKLSIVSPLTNCRVGSS